jgi:chromosome partitioning protein
LHSTTGNACSASTSTRRGNFGISYGIDPRQLELTSYHLLTSESPQVRDYIMELKPNLHLIPNAIAPDLENRLEASHNRDSLLRLRLRQLRGQYDYVIIDTPPAMRTATMNAIVAADEIIVVVDFCESISHETVNVALKKTDSNHTATGRGASAR